MSQIVKISEGKMALLTYFLIALLVIIFCLYAFIFIRVYTNPLKRIPGRPLTSPIFGHFIEYIQNECRLLDFVKYDRATYGTIRLSYLFFGKQRLHITEPIWIKVISLFY